MLQPYPGPRPIIYSIFLSLLGAMEQSMVYPAFSLEICYDFNTV